MLSYYCYYYFIINNNNKLKENKEKKNKKILNIRKREENTAALGIKFNFKIKYNQMIIILDIIQFKSEIINYNSGNNNSE